jgi:hypothetical protein
MLGKDYQKWTFEKLLRQDFLMERLKLYYLNLKIQYSKARAQYHPLTVEHVIKRYQKTFG